MNKTEVEHKTHGTPILLKEFVNHISGKWNLRVYYSLSHNKWYRWHFGYPKAIIDPLLPLLETTPFWGESHWCEIDGYYLYWLPILSESNEPNTDIVHKLNQEDSTMIAFYNDCLSILKKWNAQ